MNDQRNLFLAIGLSIAIILFFQVFFPAQPIQNSNNNKNEILEPSNSIDDQNSTMVKIVKSKKNFN